MTVSNPKGTEVTIMTTSIQVVRNNMEISDESDKCTDTEAERPKDR